MPIVRGRPHPGLAGVVGSYADFAERTDGPKETAEAPGGGLVVLVDLDSGWTVEGERFGSFAGGIYARPVRVRHEGTSRGVQFDVEPPAARALLGVPAGELGHRVVGLEDLLGREAALLAERLAGAASAKERFALLDAALLRRLDAARQPVRPDVARAWTLLRATGGRMRVGALADALGCSPRHLGNAFAAEVGVPPKTAARLIRFEAARARVADVPLARLAADHGFSDQAHLSREFRELGGAPPTAFRSVQAAQAPAP
jgi:AraC-like DNA-binding protein